MSENHDRQCQTLFFKKKKMLMLCIACVLPQTFIMNLVSIDFFSFTTNVKLQVGGREIQFKTS